MKVLITGARGLLGRALVASAPADATIEAAPRAALDIRDAGAVERALASHRPDVVINAAAFTAVDAAESALATAQAVNAHAVETLAQAASSHDARLVHVSTDYVFAGTHARAHRPDDPAGPLSVYGGSKRDGEIAALAASPDALVVRTAWLHGPSGRNFVTAMLARMRAGTALRVVADQIGTPTATAHLAATLWRLIALDARGILHVTDSGVASWYDFAVAIQEEALAQRLIDTPVPITPIATVDYPTPARRPAFSVLDTSATAALLGETPPHWRDGLRATLRAMAAGEAAHG